jgi:hypothetical protein
MIDSKSLHARMGAFTLRSTAAASNAKAVPAFPSLASTVLLGACPPRTHIDLESII